MSLWMRNCNYSLCRHWETEKLSNVSKTTQLLVGKWSQNLDNLALELLSSVLHCLILLSARDNSYGSKLSCFTVLLLKSACLMTIPASSWAVYVSEWFWPTITFPFSFRRQICPQHWGQCYHPGILTAWYSLIMSFWHQHPRTFRCWVSLPMVGRMWSLDEVRY